MLLSDELLLCALWVVLCCMWSLYQLSAIPPTGRPVGNTALGPVRSEDGNIRSSNPRVALAVASFIVITTCASPRNWEVSVLPFGIAVGPAGGFAFDADSGVGIDYSTLYERHLRSYKSTEKCLSFSRDFLE